MFMQEFHGKVRDRELWERQLAPCTACWSVVELEVREVEAR